jgi:hypothetical protein
MTDDMTREHAAALRQAASDEARNLSRKTKIELVTIYQSCGGYGGGTWSKQDLTAAIMEIRYPVARQNQASHVLHHIAPAGTTPGIGSSACLLCRCQATRISGGFLIQCGNAPHGDDVPHWAAGGQWDNPTPGHQS